MTTLPAVRSLCSKTVKNASKGKDLQVTMLRVQDEESAFRTRQSLVESAESREADGTQLVIGVGQKAVEIFNLPLREHRKHGEEKYGTRQGDIRVGRRRLKQNGDH